MPGLFIFPGAGYSRGMPDEHPLVGHTKHGDLTLDQLAELQPGLGTLMRDISDRWR